MAARAAVVGSEILSNISATPQHAVVAQKLLPIANWDDFFTKVYSVDDVSTKYVDMKAAWMKSWTAKQADGHASTALVAWVQVSNPSFRRKTVKLGGRVI